MKTVKVSEAVGVQLDYMATNLALLADAYAYASAAATIPIGSLYRDITQTNLKTARRAFIDEVQRVEAENAVLKTRYETVRRMNPRQFAELYRANIEQGILFDDLVDNAVDKPPKVGID
jgi:hypothetical protein